MDSYFHESTLPHNLFFFVAVTAGVLRGERARFQLFGDTMNTASRMESTGLPNQIHVSSEFFSYLAAAGRSNWASPRGDQVFVKGKGYLQTYFLDFQTENPHYADTTPSSIGGDARLSLENAKRNTELMCEDESGDLLEKGHAKIDLQYSEKRKAKIERLVGWNVDLLSNLLKEIIASRKSKGVSPSSENHNSLLEKAKIARNAHDPISEVKEIIQLPAYSIGKQINPQSIVLDQKIVEQLTSYVKKIADLYQDNPFHNFEHASHVSMSVVSRGQSIIRVNVQLIDSTHSSLPKPIVRSSFSLVSLPQTWQKLAAV